MPVTILEVVEHRLRREARTGNDFAQAGLAMLGGCERCGATIAAYNAYPSKWGFWRCEDCIGDDRWERVEDAAREILETDGGPDLNDVSDRCEGNDDES